MRCVFLSVHTRARSCWILQCLTCIQNGKYLLLACMALQACREQLSACCQQRPLLKTQEHHQSPAVQSCLEALTEPLQKERSFQQPCSLWFHGQQLSWMLRSGCAIPDCSDNVHAQELVLGLIQGRVSTVSQYSLTSTAMAGWPFSSFGETLQMTKAQLHGPVSLQNNLGTKINCI